MKNTKQRKTKKAAPRKAGGETGPDKVKASDRETGPDKVKASDRHKGPDKDRTSDRDKGPDKVKASDRDKGPDKVMESNAVKGAERDGESKEKKVVAAKKRSPTPRQIERQVREVLIGLLDASESDSVRVAAARVLMDRIDKGKSEKDAARKTDPEHENAKQEREDALAQAYALLGELAAARAVGVAGAGAVD